MSIAGQRIPVTATPLTGADRERALAKFFEYPMYRAYRQRTARDLRVFALARSDR